MSTCHRAELKNGTQIYYGMLDQSKTIKKELQLDIRNTLYTRKTIKLGNKHGKRK